MESGRITINGQHYESPDAMPPDVRRIYEEAMRTIDPSVASGQEGGTTEVRTAQGGFAGLGLKTNIVVRNKITVNDRTYGSIDELPADLRGMVEDALQQAKANGGVTRTTPHLHVSLNLGRPRVRTIAVSGVSPPTPPLPIEPSSTESSLRHLLSVLALLVVGGLVLWAFLGR